MNFIGIVLSIIFLSWLSLAFAENVKVLIRGANPIAKTDDNFICATMDWWPADKCDYNQCLWKNDGLLDFELNNKILMNAIKALNPLRIKIGGSLQDQVEYNVRDDKICPNFQKEDDGLFGFSPACLPMQRWDELNNMFNQTGAKVTFGLNALIGRKESKIEKGLWIGDWQSQNSIEFLNYTISKGYEIDSYEFGNKLCRDGIGARIEAEQYGKDIKTLKSVIKKLHPDPNTQPKVLGPSCSYDGKWFNTFLEVSGVGIIDGITHHIYNLGPGDDPNLITNIQDPFYLDQIAKTYQDVSNVAKKLGLSSGAWVSEANGAFDSGHNNVSSTFYDVFWYLDQLGMAATFNHKVFCRQTLIGGNYALINTTAFAPNPDYYGALLWHRLMGSTVLSVTQDVDSNLRVYAHCAKEKSGISLLFINLSKEKNFNVSLTNDENMRIIRRNLESGGVMRPNFEFKGQQKREEYHLTTIEDDIWLILLNEDPLVVTDSNDIPTMDPKFIDASTPISVAPQSIVYITIRDFHAQACI